jgi:signal transduction histidine kinase/DNA-binding NarL/FixJ family response regulator
MLVFHTELHIITFLIILLEMVFFCHQIIYFLSRPSDKNRLYFLILLYLLIQHNLIGGLLPDPNIPIPTIVQNIIAYGVAFAMAMYFPYYFYKAFKLEKMKFYAYWGNILFLFAPFVLLFITPYYLTNDFAFSRKLAMIVPFIYTLSFLYSLRYAINARNRDLKNTRSKKDILGMYIAVILFGFLPVIAFFETNLNGWLRPILHFHNGSQVVEILTTNSGLLVMTFLFIRQTVTQARNEYNQLLTSEKQLQELNSELMIKVKERTKELELANEQKTNVFINLAHETKTPLTLITNYLDEYIKKNGQTETKELGLLKSAITKLTKDIVNFFDMEKIQKGVNMYNHNYLSNFSSLLTESVALFKVLANKKQIEITSNIEEDIYIKADPSAVCRIINNLIENAIKYTSQNGKIEVILTLINSQIHFAVMDNGIGIPSSLKEKIFEPYFQINSEKANYQGIGLGLSIIKKIVTELKGEIVIGEACDNQNGTRIAITLPFYAKSTNELIIEFTDDTKILFEVEKSTIVEQPFDTHKFSILIVEDNVDLLALIVNALNEKYNVYYALNANEAIEKLKLITKLDLVISDVMMDNGDGWLLQNHIQTTNFKHIPFIFLTAKMTIEDRLKGLTSGAIDYICKPVSMRELECRINSLLTNFSNHRVSILNESDLASFEQNCIKYNISHREIDVIKLMSEGKINKEIAAILEISVDTVKKHIQNSFEKVGVNNKIELLKRLEVRNIVK